MHKSCLNLTASSFPIQKSTTATTKQRFLKRTYHTALYAIAPMWSDSSMEAVENREYFRRREFVLILASHLRLYRLDPETHSTPKAINIQTYHAYLTSK